MPDVEEAAEDDQFAKVVGGVVGDEQGFAEEVLAVAPAEGFVEIGFGVFDEGDEVFEVGAHGGDGLVPGVGRGWLRRLGPVVVGPFDGVVAAGGRSGEVEDVALCDAEVLEELPRGVRQIGWYDAAMIGWEVFDRIVEGSVGLATPKEGD